jgi:hypothetical protein
MKMLRTLVKSYPAFTDSDAEGMVARFADSVKHNVTSWLQAR